MTAQLQQLQEKIEYTFRDPELLHRALSHSSYVNERQNEHQSNERLEFLGDSVLGFITAERLLFLTGTAVLFLTLSRVGLGAFLITAAFCALVFVNRLIRALTAKAGPDKRGILTVTAFFGVFLVLAAIGWGILHLLAKLDFRMAGLFDLQLTNRPDAVFYFAEKLSLAARFVYWDGGFSIFSRYPLFGVGLGHAGFYLPHFLNDYAFRLTEVRNLLYRSQTLLNIKSLWIRILAETGRSMGRESGVEIIAVGVVIVGQGIP